MVGPQSIRTAMEIEYTLEEIKQKNTWLASENRRMIVTIGDLNETIERQQKNADVMLKALKYCSFDGVGTAYQQGDARWVVMQMNEPRYKSALKNVKDEHLKKQMTDLWERMSDRCQIVSEGEFHRYLGFMDEHSTHKEVELTRNPFGDPLKTSHAKT